MASIELFKKTYIDPILKDKLGLISFVNGEDSVITKAVFFDYSKGFSSDSRIQRSADSQIIISDLDSKSPVLDFYYNTSCTPDSALTNVPIDGQSVSEQLENFCDFIVEHCSDRSATYCRVGASCKQLVIEPRLANQAYTYCVDNGLRLPPALEKQGKYVEGQFEDEGLPSSEVVSINKELLDLGESIKASIIKPSAVMQVREPPKPDPKQRPETIAKKLQNLVNYGFDQPQVQTGNKRLPPKKAKW